MKDLVFITFRDFDSPYPEDRNPEITGVFSSRNAASAWNKKLKEAETSSFMGYIFWDEKWEVRRNSKEGKR